MELGLSLGDSSKALVGFMEKPREASNQLAGLGGFNTTLSIGPIITRKRNQHQQEEAEEEEEEEEAKASKANNNHHHRTEGRHHHQLDLLPQLSLPWPPSENGSLSGEAGGSSKGLAAAEDEAALSSSPNSAASSFQMDLCIFRGGSYSSYKYGGGGKRDSDEDDNGGDGGTRKKLRLSKEQSAYLEESFKEHNTLNPKQKLALARLLNLRPRQVEVWFQNRRARTKLKQTEVDCEYLKRCCETLTEENRRLHKELQEVRALKTSNAFYMQLPATTLTMCPSCERIATNPASAAATAGACKNSSAAGDAGFPHGNKPRLHRPFARTAQQPPSPTQDC